MPSPLAYLEAHPVLRTRDLDEARDLTAGMWERHTVQVRGRAAFETAINSFHQGGVSFSYVDCPTPLLVQCEPINARCYLYLVLEGGVTHTVRGRPFRADPGTAVVLGPGQCLQMEARPSRVLMLDFDREALAPALAAIGQPADQLEDWAASIDLATPAGRSLFSLCDWAARELDQDGSSLSQPVPFSHLQSTLTGVLLHTLLPRFPAGASEEQWVGVVRLNDLTAWVRENLYRPLHIADLGRQAGVSARAVQLAFLRHLGCTPLQFVRRLRLQEARRVFTADPRRSVASVALSLGFHHPGRFAQAYAREFGETPGQTRDRRGPS